MTIAMAAAANEDEEREVRRGVVVTRGRAPVVPTRAAETPKQVLMADAARRGPPQGRRKARTARNSSLVRVTAP